MWVSICSVIVAVLAFGFSVFSFRESRRIDFDKAMLNSCDDLLCRSYELLVKGRQGNGFPVSDRVQWLTSARYIMRYYDAKKRIKTKPYRVLVDNTEEVWRHEFYKALDFPEVMRSEYFYHDESGGIYPTSAMIIAEFSTWKEDVRDPVDDYDDERFLNNKKYKARFSAIFSHAARYSQYREMMADE
ncbi:hypothetical protein [Alcanivorax sp. 24]|uniref:hypothetical protein n=1 Tax=Alcanivorax sp. 24 TaxID=2545266 RepID=UPI00105B551A|nr:hypothetical protein [Alcanivorax sp. 24]